MNEQVTNVIFAGVGGQGSVLASHLLADAALHSGLAVKLTETFGAATRGGSVFSCVRLGEAWAPLPGPDEVQAVVALEPLEGLRVATRFLAPGGSVLMNVTPWYPLDVSVGRVNYPPVEQLADGCRRLGGRVITLDATALAREAGSTRAMNVVLLGGLMALGIVALPEEALFEQMRKRWNEKLVAVNLKAFRLGFDSVRAQSAEPARA